MNRLIKLKGKVTYDREAVKEQIASLPDGIYYLTISKPKKMRSTDQNSYLWGVVYKIIGDYLGYSCEEIHEMMKFKFLGVRKDKNDLMSLRSTTELSTQEFSEYTEKIRRWGAEFLSLNIPEPNEKEI